MASSSVHSLRCKHSPARSAEQIGYPRRRLWTSLVRVDAFGGDFDLVHAAEGEQELHEVLGRLLGSLSHDVADGVCDRGLKHHAFGLQAGKVDAHKLASLEHRSSKCIVPPRRVKCKAFRRATS